MVFQLGQNIQIRRSDGSEVNAEIVEIYAEKLKVFWKMNNNKCFKFLHINEIIKLQIKENKSGHLDSSYHIKCLRSYFKLVASLTLLFVFVSGVIYEQERSKKVIFIVRFYIL
jgi:hypothetical protein